MLREREKFEIIRQLEELGRTIEDNRE